LKQEGPGEIPPCTRSGLMPPQKHPWSAASSSRTRGELPPVPEAREIGRRPCARGREPFHDETISGPPAHAGVSRVAKVRPVARSRRPRARKVSHQSNSQVCASLSSMRAHKSCHLRRAVISHGNSPLVAQCSSCSAVSSMQSSPSASSRAAWSSTSSASVRVTLAGGTGGGVMASPNERWRAIDGFASDPPQDGRGAVPSLVPR
jgi:hypothetical protein